MQFLFSQISTISSGTTLSFYSEQPVIQLLTDSRIAAFSEGALFFAISGKNHDGHRYVEELYQKGIRQFVIEDETKVNHSHLIEANIWLAKSSVQTLQDIASFHRSRFQIPTIGITGSNGKTTIKEWLYQLLSSDFSIVKSPKSYNSQIGVPLSVWQMRPDNELAIFEAGISHLGEMTNLEKVIKPTIGIFTNIGPAHAEGFPNIESKIEEKSKLFTYAEKIIYCKRHLPICTFLESRFPAKNLISWDLAFNLQSCTITIYKDAHASKHEFHLPFKDEASVENLAHCIVAALEMQLPENQIQEKIIKLANIPMRLELKAGRNNCYVIDDTYNNDPEGLKIALQFMQQQDMKRQKILILSEMLETGIETSELYRQVADLIKEKQITCFIGVGATLLKHQHYFGQNASFFENTEELMLALPKLDFKDSLILVKGARLHRFERIVQALAQKIHRTVLEVNLNALAHNLTVFRQMIKPETKMMVMVKAFAYGSGSHEIAHLLQYHKVDYLAVAYTDEGIELRENNIQLPIMVMNPAADEFEKLVKYKLEPEIYSFSILEAFVRYQSSITHEPKTHKLKIHLAIDTGMHRLGFEEFQLNELCPLLKSSSIEVASVFSHLVGADGAEHDAFSDQQATIFERIATEIESQLDYKVIKHLLNSAGITRLSNYQFDMVRLGIGLYGIESDEHPANAHLQNVSTLKTIISQIREVKKGESVGYSRKGTIQQDSKIATLAIGYADGYSRVFGNGTGKVWIKGKLAPIVGNVCMDMCMADISGIEVEEGDEAIIFGEQLPVAQVAKWANTISYEILTNVSERVKRVFYLD